MRGLIGSDQSGRAVTQLYQLNMQAPSKQVIGMRDLAEFWLISITVADAFTGFSPCSVSGIYNLSEALAQFCRLESRSVSKDTPLLIPLPRSLTPSTGSLRGGHTVFFGKFYIPILGLQQPSVSKL